MAIDYITITNIEICCKIWVFIMQKSLHIRIMKHNAQCKNKNKMFTLMDLYNLSLKKVQLYEVLFCRQVMA